MEDETRGSRKVRQGLVVSDKMDKTVVVAVERRVADRLYGKQVVRTRKYYVHDEQGIAHAGDTVRIMETRPLSKQKRWRVLDVVDRAE